MEEKKYINIDNMATRLCQILKDARESMVDDENKDFIMENFSDEYLEDYSNVMAWKFNSDMKKYLHNPDHRICGNFNNIDYDYPYHIYGEVTYDTPLVNAMVARLDAGEDSEQANEDRDFLVDWFFETFGTWGISYKCMEAYGSDYVTSLRTFEKLTNTQSCSWSVNYSGYNFNFKYNNNPIFECPIDCSNDIYAEELCGKLLFRYINNNIMPYITQGRYYSSSGKYINEKYTYKYRRSRIIKSVGDDCPLTGMCYDFYLLEPIIKYYKTWCSYPDNFSLTDLIEQCYDSFFKCWHEEYEYWANDENAIREELHNNQYEDRLYYMDGRVYSGPLDDVA